MHSLPALPVTSRAQLDRAIETCLAGLSANTRRAYSSRIQRFLAWCQEYPGGRGLTRGDVSSWAQAMADSQQSAVSVNQALSAVKRLAQEAANLGWLDWDEAVRIQSVKSRKYRGVRSGKWLTIEQVRTMLAMPDRATLPGRRDAVVLALLIGCGLRREEACRLTVKHVVTELTERGPVMLIRNLDGKGGKVRTIQAPEWVRVEVRDWMQEARITEGKVLRSFK